jgi:hypothetical protein
MQNAPRTIRQTLPTLLCWLCALALFAGLRFDNSERVYFPADDQLVLWLVDDIVATGNWQPDWYRIQDKLHRNAYQQQEAARTELPHAHHYNFTAHILLSATVIKPLRLFGVETSTITLLHHIAFFWDSVSWLLLIAAAARLGGTQLALCSALTYALFPLAVQGSHYARPDAFLTAMGSATLLLALQVRNWPRWRWLLLNGLVIGAAIGGKASQLMLGVFPAIAASQYFFSNIFIADNKKQHWRELVRVVGDGCAILALIALVLALMFYAGHISPHDFWLSLQSIQLYYQYPGPPDVLEHYSFATQLLNILHYFYATLGSPLLLAMAIGTISLARKTDKLPLLLLTVPLLIFTAYFASVPAFFDRSFCALAAAIVLLAASGIVALADQFTSLRWKTPLALLLTLAACYQPIQINLHLHNDLLQAHHNDSRLAFQKKLQQQWQEKNNGVNYWIKNIDRSDMFSQTPPEKPPKNPRIYVMEDLNDSSARGYAKTLRNNGFVQIAEFRGGFADMPTNSLITVHEAARFIYWIRCDEELPPVACAPEK